MMKKLGMLAFIMALVAAFALPAFAYTVEGAKGERFTIGGNMSYDIGYRTINKDNNALNTYIANFNTLYANGSADAAAGGVKVPQPYAGPGFVDKTQFFTGLSFSSTIWAQYVVGNASVYWRMYTASDIGTYNKVNNDQLGSWAYSALYAQNYRDIIGMDVYYGAYKFGSFTLSAGKMDASTITIAPSQKIGYEPSGGGHIAGIGYGFVYDQKIAQLRLHQQISKVFGYQISLVQPGTYASIGGGTKTSSTDYLTNTRMSYPTYPMIAGKALVTLGVINFFPAFAWQQVKWDSLPAGWDTDMTSWLVRLPVKAVVGPFVAQAEVTYGQNLGAGTQMANICNGESSFGLATRDASGKLLSANTFAYWADLSMTFGPVTPHIYFSQTNSYGDKAFWNVGESSNTRTMYGINATYVVTPNFFITPEIAWWDLGTYMGRFPYTGTTGFKMGGDMVAGIQFQFNF